MRSKLFGVAMLLTGAFSTHAAVVAQQASEKGETVRIQVYPGGVALIPYVAAEKGFCQKYGITCELVTIPSSVVGLQSLLSKGIDVATPAVEAFLQLAAQGSPVRTLGNIYRGSAFFLVFGGEQKQSGSREYRDIIHGLKGKRIGVTTLGSGPDYALRTYLKDASMSVDDVTIVAIGAPDTAYPALVHRQVDAAITFPPMAAFCDVLKTCNVAFWVRDKSPEIMKGFDKVMIPATIRRDYSPKNVEALRKAFKDAEMFLQSKENLDEVRKIQAKYVKFDNPKADELRHKVLENILPAQYFDQMEPNGLKAAINYMVSTGQLKQTFDPSGHIEP